MKKVDGQNIIYHYIQKNILANEDEFSKNLIQKFMIDLSIWLPVDFYEELSIILPYVVRDSRCRRPIDEWGSSNTEGFLRDDNTLIKGIVNSFIIKSPKIGEYNGNKKGNGFVASHIWRKISINQQKILASKHHKTYSFIPNLVWLPSQISKLTDREGSYAQQVLQTLSHKIYNSKGIKVDEKIKEIWNSLPNPDLTLEGDMNSLNFFEVPKSWILKRKNQLLKELDLIQDALTKLDKTTAKIKCSRYRPTLLKINEINKQTLLNWLNYYKKNILK